MLVLGLREGGLSEAPGRHLGEGGQCRALLWRLAAQSLVIPQRLDVFERLDFHGALSCLCFSFVEQG